MPNYEIAVMPTTPVAIIACAIHCCDRKVYDLGSYKNQSPCMALGKKKDTCVRQNVKRALEKNKIKNVQVEPKQTVTANVMRRGKLTSLTHECKPDFMVDNRIIDAKFSCDSDKLAPKMAPIGKRASVQDLSVGAAKKTDKEKIFYPKMKGPDGKKVKSVRVMGPKEANKKKGQCTCS